MTSMEMWMTDSKSENTPSMKQSLRSHEERLIKEANNLEAIVEEDRDSSNNFDVALSDYDRQNLSPSVKSSKFKSSHIRTKIQKQKSMPQVLLGNIGLTQESQKYQHIIQKHS